MVWDSLLTDKRCEVLLGCVRQSRLGSAPMILQWIEITFYLLSLILRVLAYFLVVCVVLTRRFGKRSDLGLLSMTVQQTCRCRGTHPPT